MCPSNCSVMETVWFASTRPTRAASAITAWACWAPEHGLCVGHQVHKGVSPRRRRGRPGGNVLLILKARGAPVAVQINEPWQQRAAPRPPAPPRPLRAVPDRWRRFSLPQSRSAVWPFSSFAPRISITRSPFLMEFWVKNFSRKRKKSNGNTEIGNARQCGRATGPKQRCVMPAFPFPYKSSDFYHTCRRSVKGPSLRVGPGAGYTGNTRQNEIFSPPLNVCSFRICLFKRSSCP